MTYLVPLITGIGGFLLGKNKGCEEDELELIIALAQLRMLRSIKNDLENKELTLDTLEGEEEALIVKSEVQQEALNLSEDQIMNIYNRISLPISDSFGPEDIEEEVFIEDDDTEEVE